MRKWGIEDWTLIVLLAVTLGFVGAWYFGRELQQSFSQLVGIAISGTTLALFTAFRSETIRWQDSHMRRIDNSDKVIDFYNQQVRELVIKFMLAFDQIMTTHPDLEDQTEFELTTASRLGLAKILHLIDKIAWLIAQNGYLEKADVLSAITSELSRLLASKKYQRIIEQTLETSSLAYVGQLIVKLKGARSHDHAK